MFQQYAATTMHWLDMPLNIMWRGIWMDGDACGVQMKPTKSAPSIEPRCGHTLLLLSFNGGCLCVSMEMMPTNSMQLLLRIDYILCHALHIHYVTPAWRMLLAVWWWGLSIVCQPLFADGGCCLQYCMVMRPFNSVVPTIVCRCSHTLLLSYNGGCLW